MTTNKILIEHLKYFEGCKLTAYQCPAGVWTVGFGCTGKDIKQGTKWTQDIADSELARRSDECLESALKMSPILRDESPGRQAAIASFIFNCGKTAYKNSTLKQFVDVADWSTAAAQIKRWTRAGSKVLPGLVARREIESKFLLEAI